MKTPQQIIKEKIDFLDSEKSKYIDTPNSQYIVDDINHSIIQLCDVLDSINLAEIHSMLKLSA